jgi:hypothetical protein
MAVEDERPVDRSVFDDFRSIKREVAQCQGFLYVAAARELVGFRRNGQRPIDVGADLRSSGR